MLDALSSSRERHRCHLWAYVIMPEHVYILLWFPTPDHDISAVLRSLKQPISQKAVRFARANAPEFLPRMLDVQPSGKRSYRFWQRGGGFDRNIWEDRYIWSMIDYIHANPVRRGLARVPEDWAWSSAREYLSHRGDGWPPLDRDSLPWHPS